MPCTPEKLAFEVVQKTRAGQSPPDRKNGAADGLGLGDSVFDRNGEARASFNCFSCHAGVVRGQVVAGLGNSHVMFSSLPGSQGPQTGSRRSLTRGDNYGPCEVWKLGAMLEDPANKGLALAKEKTKFQSLIESLDLPGVDPMPWRNMQYKKLNYWYSDAGSHSPENFSIPHSKLNEHWAEHIKIVGKALAFARETVSPIYPETLDANLVRQGADLFHGRSAPANRTGFVSCKNCHGTYTRKPGHDDLSQPGPGVSVTISPTFSATPRPTPLTTTSFSSFVRLPSTAINLKRTMPPKELRS